MRIHHEFDKKSYETIHADEICDKDFQKNNLLVENVRWKPGNPNRKGRHLKEIVNMIQDYPNVGIAYDISHAHINGEPMEEIIKYKDYIKLFHINDTVGKQDKHLSIGRGEIDYDKFFKILDEINFRGILIIER